MGGSTVHAASSSITAPSHSAPAAAGDGSAYNFKDFKDIKGKLSLAPGAVVEEYEDILASVEVKGEKVLEDEKHATKQVEFSIGESGGDGESTSLSALSREAKRGRRASKRAQKKKQDENQISEWKSDGDSTRKGKGGDVVLTDKMAFNNYRASLSPVDKITSIKKGTACFFFPMLIITTIRGQVRAYREKKWVQKGLTIKEEERQNYLDEKKKKKEGKNDDNDDDDDNNDDNDDSDDKDVDDDE